MGLAYLNKGKHPVITFRNLAIACALLFVTSPAAAATSHSGLNRTPSQGPVVKHKVTRSYCVKFKYCHYTVCGCAVRSK